MPRIADVAITGLVTVLGVIAPATAQVSFTSLVPAVSDQPSFAHGISADGSTIVGHSGYIVPFDTTEQPVQWSMNPGVLPDLREPDPYGPRGSVFAASANGSVLVGKALSNFSLFYRATQWVNGQASVLPVAPGVPFDGAVARAVSANGSVAVGFSFRDSQTYRAHRWVDGTPTLIPGASGYGYDEATGVSADGSEIAGFSFAHPNAFSHGVGWVWANGQTRVLQTPVGSTGVWVNGISGDGSTVFGQVNMGLPQADDQWIPALWQGSQVSLLPIPAGSEAFALAASFDGSTVAGKFFQDPLGPASGFVWDAAHGMRGVSDLLAAGNISVGDLRLREVDGISADGRTLAGTAVDSQNRISSWVATIPSPSVFLMSSCGLVFVRRPRRAIRCAGADGTE